ncbi:MAG: hypothetical protein WAN87_07685 [Thermoplasmata archaeon]
MSILAGALARRAQTPFAWASCSETEEPLDEQTHRWLAEHSEFEGETAVDPQELEPSRARDPGHSGLLLPESMAEQERIRLTEFLSLPPLFQRLLARTMSAQGQALIVLTNVDALRSRLQEHVLSGASVHRILHREGVTLVATFRGSPTSHLARVFDEVYAVDAPPHTPWADARITRERGDPARGTPVAGSLREWLYRLGVSEDPVSNGS